MGELSPRALGWFVEAVLPAVMERTGLPREEAAIAAESLVPPFEQDDEGSIVLRGADGEIVGVVSKDGINPFDVIDDIEESGAAAEIEESEESEETGEGDEGRAGAGAGGSLSCLPAGGRPCSESFPWHRPSTGPRPSRP